MPADEADVVAGLAGFTAARELAAAGREVVVLEARDRVGGRVLNHPIGDGKVVEVGGQWIGPGQDRIATIAKELGVETFPTYDTGRNVLCFGKKTSTYSGTIPRINPIVLADVGRAQAAINRLARRVPLEAPWQAEHAERWDGQTFETWLHKAARTRVGRELVRLGIEAVFACEPADVSLLHVLFYVHSAGTFELLIDTRGGAQQDRFVGGSQAVTDRMAAELGDRVHLGAPVRYIRHGGEIVDVLSDRTAVKARRAIVSVPPAL